MSQHNQQQAITPTGQPDPLIMDVHERQQILTQIARGLLTIKKRVIENKEPATIEIWPDYTDRKNAIAELNKMDGIYAAEEVKTGERYIIIRPKQNELQR